MEKQHLRNRSVYQQTIALFWKNVILKWRMKAQSFQEWISSIILILLLLITQDFSSDYLLHQIPEATLGQLDDSSFNFTGLKIVYTPGTKMARQIMEKVATVSVMKGIRTELIEDEKAMDAAQREDEETLGVVFQDDFSYRLRFPSSKMGWPNDAAAYIDSCYNYSSSYCKSPLYWFEGFLPLQSSIDSALIELITSHSVWDEMKSTSGIRLSSPALLLTDSLSYSLFHLFITICFSPFMYFLSQNVSREKRKLKEVMKTMGLRDMAFWLSWGLLYAVYLLIMSCMHMALTKSIFYPTSTFSAVFLLFFIYGISSIHFCFMISALLKKPKSTSYVVFLLTVCFGALSLTTLFMTIPAPLEWTFSIFCPFAFGAAVTKVSFFNKYGKTFSLSSLMEEFHFHALLFDSVLYMLLALYFDKVVPDKYGVPYPPLFFLKKSHWFKSRSGYSRDAPTDEQSHGHLFSDNMEAVPPEFDGKEAIRLNNIKKAYQVEGTKTEALRGLSLNIYEGQITAVLGHSGAGKTTLLNILSGLSKPSDGSATIFKYNISEREDMEQIRQISAVCPQFNIQFELLTVKENLKTFAKIKGIPSTDIEKEVQMLLTLLDMKVIQDTQANRLSGGQKRKLTLGITFLGDPQVLLLDEPTIGLDPYSRHQVWALLNEHKASRVTLFTTQFMDEADILADRKAFISHGMLKCVGSSLFLKKRWGIGYHLRMQINEVCDPKRTTALVEHYIPAGKLSGQRENELSYILPLENMDKFPDDGVLRREYMEERKRGASSPDEIEQDLLLLSDTGKASLRGTELWRQQVCAVARMHFLDLKRERKLWGSILLIAGIIFIPSSLQLITLAIVHNLNSIELHPRLYFEPGQTSVRGTAGLLVLNDTGGSIDNFIHAVKSQNIFVETVTGHNVSDHFVHNGAIKVALQDKKYRFTLMCHMEIINCFPVLMNIISNALLQTLNSTARIRIWSQSVTNIDSRYLWMYFSEVYMTGILLLFPAFPTHFAMTSIRYYKMKSWAQLRVSGLFPSAYWCGLSLVDIPLYWILLLLLFGTFYLFFFIMNTSKNPTMVLSLVPFLLGYGTSVVLFLYVIAFIFRKKSYSSSFWSFLFIVGLLLVFVVGFVFTFWRQIHYVLDFCIPMVPAAHFFISLTMLLGRYSLHEEEISTVHTQLLISTLAPYVQSVVFIILLRCLELKYGRPLMRRDPVFRISPQRERSHQNPEEPGEDVDRDVQDERARARSALMSTNQEEKPVIVAHNLRKEYKSKKACSCCKKDKAGGKVATRNVSFCVKKGEVLGLLGPNGAGKSTTISMITGDTDVTAGQVLIKRADAAATEEDTAGFLGYCPQENALWPNLTMKEHLEIYAAVKGIRKDAAAIAINRIVQALELQGHLKKATKTLAAGLARKLCFALSMMGNPTVMLLDEPSTGMDPKGKRQVWKTIHAVLKDKDQGAILTTHHMEEAEAVCDRVAIMVSGLLRCLGPIQYLKSKFGKNYLLQIKVKGIEQGDLVNTEILKMFPHAARQERISTLLCYKIPMEDALPLSKAFSMLEEAKRNFNLEEYSFSLNTLEQVFLELCKEQEREDFDRPLDTPFEWKQLQRGDL
ncbi:ABC-type organic anion transporter ABCA8B-like isoform X2 [Hemicordylus capensis]|uniref:ABC-type organic anion transporter ABCA8B-like isoform X2 n=1 Tax=Hemicordylus capensis TaxID=884348 RepID=UPI002303B7E4|nr:ABC-type organic anion transporter ABCA8B-like isoform X2 [Hemicordylus capensis]